MAPIYALLGSARHALALTMYELEDTRAEQLLAVDARRGVDVRVLLNRTGTGSRNEPAFTYLQGHGVHVRWAGSLYALTHQKALVVDGSVAAIMTLNWTTRYYATTRDVAVIDRRMADVEAIQTTFNADYNQTRVEPASGAGLVWSPTTALPELLGMINGANRELDIENEEMGIATITEALIEAARRGVRVEICMTELEQMVLSVRRADRGRRPGARVRPGRAAVHPRQGDRPRSRSRRSAGVRGVAELLDRVPRVQPRARHRSELRRRDRAAPCDVPWRRYWRCPLDRLSRHRHPAVGCEDGNVVDELLTRLLGARSSAIADVAPDGAELLVRCDDTGSMQVYRLPAQGGDRIQVTFLDEPVSAARYIPGTDDVVVAVDRGGNENYQLWLVDLQGGEPRPLVVEENIKHDLGDVSRDGRLIAFSSTRRNGIDIDVYVLDLADGSVRSVLEGGWNRVECFSPDGRWLTVVRLDGSFAISDDLLLVDLETGDVRTVVERTGAGTAVAPTWYPDSSGFLFSTDAGRDVASIARYDMATASLALSPRYRMGQRGKPQR